MSKTTKFVYRRRIVLIRLLTRLYLRIRSDFIVNLLVDPLQEYYYIILGETKWKQKIKLLKNNFVLFSSIVLFYLAHLNEYLVAQRKLQYLFYTHVE